ncbi:hypothetical protein LP52_06975 [Streptomonospora alba]|uniref:DUF1963 domain-containing protein n=1 Tax=Streptomonospora alba TaxID=183763 RepID=A0A0C2FJU7_9ACTN|nr:DUF1963 domain-containing protein [Streptomonospora alba]KIH99599.1 hypothetical protein LP52_06975 [Streptomonospora alba]
MTFEAQDELARFRSMALAEGIPQDEVERWIATARPCAKLESRSDGPVAGRLGGPLMLPADAPDPWCGLAATVDLAALPEEATDLPLPTDGQLLLFAIPDPQLMGCQSLGSALYIPAGTPVEERQVDLDPAPCDGEDYGEFPEGRLRLETDLSLPFHSTVHDPGPPPVTMRFPGDHLTVDQCRAWGDMFMEWADESQGLFSPGLRIGGYAQDEYQDEDPAVMAGWEAARAESKGDLPASEADIRPENWVCLAQWSHAIEGLEMSFFSWSIARQDLAAGRFDRVYATMTWNP